jgi:hypothetical protein
VAEGAVFKEAAADAVKAAYFEDSTANAKVAPKGNAVELAVLKAAAVNAVKMRPRELYSRRQLQMRLRQHISRIPLPMPSFLPRTTRLSLRY